MDPKYTVPKDYNKVKAEKNEFHHQYGKSQILPDTQTTYATAKLNGWYLKKSQSDGEHAEEDVVAQVKKLCDLNHTVLLPKGQMNKLSIHLNKSPCTSTSRDGLPATRTNGTGCTERLIAFAKTGYNGHVFYIRLKIQNLYQPQISGAKQASVRAIKELVANGVSVIGYNREAKLERAIGGETSHRGEPLSPSNVAEDDFEYSKPQKVKLKKQWESVSKAAGKPGVYKWQHNY